MTKRSTTNPVQTAAPCKQSKLEWVVYRRYPDFRSTPIAQFAYRSHAEIYLRGLSQVNADAHLMYELVFAGGGDAKD